MIKELENYTPESLIDKFYKWVVIKIESMKVKFGLGIDNQKNYTSQRINC